MAKNTVKKNLQNARSSRGAVWVTTDRCSEARSGPKIYLMGTANWAAKPFRPA